MAALAVILDANILIRFSIGRKVPRLLATYASTVDFLAPDTAFVEAKQNLPTILRARGYSGAGEIATLEALDVAAEIITARCTSPALTLARPSTDPRLPCRLICPLRSGRSLRRGHSAT